MYLCRKIMNIIVTLNIMVFLEVDSIQELTRVVGGSTTTIERYPVLAQLLLDLWENQHYIQHCAGTILTSRHVLSAAHCFQYNEDKRKNYAFTKFWKLRVGSSSRARGGILYNLKTIIKHQAFNKYYYINDIAVLVVTRTLTFGPTIRQATISTHDSEIKANQVVTLVGWGSLEANGPQPDQLQHVMMFTVDQNICVSRYSTLNAIITDSMMCAGRIDLGGVDGCHGDSGGPLIYKGLVVGLVSFGYSCGNHYFPGVYTKISHFSDWIVRTVSSNK